MVKVMKMGEDDVKKVMMEVLEIVTVAARFEKKLNK